MSPSFLNNRRFAVNPVAADDGDELHFCSTCAFSRACLSHGYDKATLTKLHVLIEHSGPFHPGDHLFKEGDEFKAISAVRSGTVKSYVSDSNGNELVLGFHMPGEVIGLSAIHRSLYPCNAVALDTVTLCQVSFQKLALLASETPQLQQLLFNMLSLEICKASLFAGDFCADERMAAFLVVLSQRLTARGFSPRRFTLTMSRADIANYLRLAPETVSRILRRMSAEGILEVNHRDMHICDLARLEALARPIMRC